PMRTVWTFHSAVSLIFGCDAVRQLGDIVRLLPAKNVLLVTDPILVKAGVADAAMNPLKAAGAAVTVFNGGLAEAPLTAVKDCEKAARAAKPDAIVALGGGSNMDIAKMTAVLLTHGGTIQDYLGDDRIPGPILPVICVPTTAGTGSEVSGAAAFT